MVTYLIHRCPFTGINHDKWLVKKTFANATVDGNAKSEAPVDIHGLSMVYPIISRLSTILLAISHPSTVGQHGTRNATPAVSRSPRSPIRGGAATSEVTAIEIG